MRVLVKVFVVSLIFVLCCGFGGKKSGIEGKLVDGNGQPLAKVKVIAEQVEPLKGYDKFETTTGSDGTFKFNGLYPSSAYKIYPLLGETQMESSIVEIQSAPEGQTSMLKAPLVGRYAMKEGIITDNKTGLQWVPANGQTMNWIRRPAMPAT